MWMYSVTFLLYILFHDTRCNKFYEDDNKAMELSYSTICSTIIQYTVLYF
jgi:hypothetical protein